MTDPTTPAQVDLDELEALAKAATPEPVPLDPHPCSIRCWRQGESFEVKPGEPCPECSDTGYRATDEASFRAAMNPAVALALIAEVRAHRWIPCSKRMPKLGVYVLATDGEIVSEARYVCTCWEDGNEDDVQLDELTHWMPLPAPPAVKEPT